MCTFKIKGRNNKVMEIGSVKRYNGVDGDAKPGPFTKYLYAWSADQNAPLFDSNDLNIPFNSYALGAFGNIAVLPPKTHD